MIIRIIKFKKSDGQIFNYFKWANPQNDYVDRYDILLPLMDALPTYADELSKQDDVFGIVSGDFDIRLSLMQSEFSAIGKTAREFFLGDTVNTKLLCIVEFQPNSPETDLCGIIKQQTIQLNERDSDYDIRFTIYGIENELFEGLNEFSISGFNGEFKLHEWLEYLLVKAQVNNVVLREELGTETWFGGEGIKVARPLLNHILKLISGNINAVQVRIPTWEAFKQIMLGLGFMFKVERITWGNPNQLYFGLYFFWLSSGITDRSIIEVKALNDHDVIEQYSPWYANENVFVLYEEYDRGSQERYLNETGYNAVFINDKFEGYVNEAPTGHPYPLGVISYGSAGNFNYFSNFYRFPTYPSDMYDFIISEKKCKVLKLPTYDQNINQQSGSLRFIYGLKIPLCRVLVRSYTTIPGYTDGGFNSIIYASALQQYQFLKKGLKKKYIIKTAYDTKPSRAKDIVIYKGVNCWIERARDINIETNTVVLEMNQTA